MSDALDPEHVAETPTEDAPDASADGPGDLHLHLVDSQLDALKKQRRSDFKGVAEGQLPPPTTLFKLYFERDSETQFLKALRTNENGALLYQFVCTGLGVDELAPNRRVQITLSFVEPQPQGKGPTLRVQLVGASTRRTTGRSQQPPGHGAALVGHSPQFIAAFCSAIASMHTLSAPDRDSCMQLVQLLMSSPEFGTMAVAEQLAQKVNSYEPATAACKPSRLRPLTGWNMFQREHKDDRRVTAAGFRSRNKSLSQRWRKLKAAEKEKYDKLAKEAYVAHYISIL